MISEFLYSAPVLALTAYLAFDINHYLSERQNTQIMARNTAYVGGSDGATADTQRRLAESQAVHVVDPDLSGSVHALASVTDESGGRPADWVDRVSQDLSDGTLARIGRVEGVAAARLTQVLDGAGSMTTFSTGAITGADVYILPPSRYRWVQASTEVDVSSSSFYRGIELLADMTRTTDGTSPTSAKRTSQAIHYARTETGFHPDGYQLQGLIGYLIGGGSDQTLWSNAGSPGNGGALTEYNRQCLMNFTQGGPQCTDANGGFETIRVFGALIRTTIIAARASVLLYPAVAPIDAATMVIRPVIDNVMAAVGTGGEAVASVASAADGVLQGAGLPGGKNPFGELGQPPVTEFLPGGGR